MPEGSDVVVGGDEFSTEGSSGPKQIMFTYGRPTAVVKDMGSSTVMACPIDSDVYPDFWMVDESSISLRLPTSAVAGQAAAEGLKVIIGLVDKDGLKDVESVALDGVGDIKGLDSTEPGGAFIIDVKPPLEEPSKGQRKLEITVYKRYETVL